MRRWIAALFLIPLLATAATAQCRLALLLAMDVSASIDAGEYQLQRDGLARALDAPDIREAFLGGPGPVALAVYEWSGRNQQTVMIDWTLIDSAAALDRVVDRVSGARRSWKDFPTAIGYALGYAAKMFRDAPECDRQVIDVSGDGTNNEGFMPDRAYAHFPLDGITVNGLVVEGVDADIIRFYQTEVLRGPGAFLEVAPNFERFEAAMARKLFREVNGLVVGARDWGLWSPG